MIIGMTGNFEYKGIPLQNAFARIDVVSSHDTHCSASVNVYASKEAFDGGSGYLEQFYPVNFEKSIGGSSGDDRTQGYRKILSEGQFSEWELVTDSH